MEGNEFAKRSQEERNIIQAKQIAATLEEVRNNGKKLDKVYKELRAVRRDLRNLDNLKPLKKGVKPDSE